MICLLLALTLVPRAVAACPGEGEDVYDSQGVRRECCPGLVESLEDRDPSDPLIGTYPKIIVCRPSRRNLRGTA